ncbi:MAG: glycosyltransferase family 1 protein [Candidatus Omnitrophota bacterium]
MRIGFDARILTVPKCGGVAYFLHLLEHLPLLDNKIELILFSPQPLLSDYAHVLKYERVSGVVVPGGAQDLSRWPAPFMTSILKQYRIDIYHQPFNADGPLFLTPCPVVISIMDLIPWVVPGIFRKPYKELRYKFRNIVWAHAASAVLTISEASKRDIVRLCHVPAKKVKVTLLGADEIYSKDIPLRERDDILKGYSLFGKKYVVNMGGLNQLRRNPDFILEGFGQYLRESGADVYLVITGIVLKQDDFFLHVQEKIAEEGIEDRVIITGFLADKELKAILSGAMVSVITSLHEGFCLPLTESMACGLPTMANDRGSIPEIAGGAAILVDPTRPDVFAKELQSLMMDAQKRDLLRQKGLERVKAFRWDDLAYGALEVYRQVMAKKVKA